MSYLFAFIVIAWFLVTVKSISFWIYLWQLKNYHIGRFVDHFRTEKGKHSLFNAVSAVKFILFAAMLLTASFQADFLSQAMFAAAMLVVYALEAVKAARDALSRKLRLPVYTKKASILWGLLLVMTLLFAFNLFFLGFHPILFPFDPLVFLVAYDLSLPITVSIAVLAFQPFAVLARSRIVAQAVHKRAQFPELKVIGITGSFGKTSTKEFLSFILSFRFRVLQTKEHQNSEVGISQCILNELMKDHEVFVCEMGAYGKGGIKLLAGIAKPSIGIFTGANEQHLATFGSMKNLLSAEGGKELVEALPKTGIAIFNGNNIHAKDLYLKTNMPHALLCGSGQGLDISAHDIRVEQQKISFVVKTKDGRQESIEASLVGGHNVDNLLLAIAGAKALGMQLADIVQQIRQMPQDLGTMKLFESKQGFSVIDSTYSANPDGVLSALEYFAVWPGKKILVMPCLIELGKASKNVHMRLGKKIQEVCDLAIITTKEHFVDIQQGSDKVVFIPEKQEIVEKIKSTVHAGDAVLLEGRGPLKVEDL